MLSVRQFLEWAEFYELEPWGFEVEDMRMSMICASIFRAAGAKNVKPRDFLMGTPLSEEVEPDPKDFARTLVQMFGAKEAKVGNG